MVVLCTAMLFAIRRAMSDELILCTTDKVFLLFTVSLCENYYENCQGTDLFISAVRVIVRNFISSLKVQEGKLLMIDSNILNLKFITK